MKGVRTIALRLTGTKEAAEELEEMGEDTSDMIVSQSKMRELIMNATKVASNNYKGFDIQDELGRYKSTYEIMLGLSQIWDEIRQADLKTGDNRQNLLLESIAGKNRASIASSILQNPDVLQSVYEDSSTKSAGSALEENQKYLDSISGHLAKLKNAWQELWANAANRDIINMFIDLGTTILNLINDVGGLQSAFTLLWGGAIVKGLATADSWLVKFVRGLDAAKASSQGLGSTLGNIFTNLTGKTDSNKETRWKGLAQIQKDRENASQQATQAVDNVSEAASDITAKAAKDAKTQSTIASAQATEQEVAAQGQLVSSDTEVTGAESTEATAKANSTAESQQAAQAYVQEAESAKLAADAIRDKANAEVESYIKDESKGLSRTKKKALKGQRGDLVNADIEFLTDIRPEADMDWTMMYAEGFEDVAEAAGSVDDVVVQEIVPAVNGATQQIGLMSVMAGKVGEGFAGIGASLAGLAVNPMTWLIGIPILINGITTGISMIKKHQQDIIDQAHEATTSWEETKTSLSDYGTQLTELRTQLNQPNLSDAEQLNIKEQIFDLQKKITAEYGKAAEGIDFVNGNLDTQLQKLREISVEEARSNLRNNKGWENASNRMNQTGTYRMLVGNNPNAIKDVIGQFGDTFKLDEPYNGGNYSIELSAELNVYDAEKKLEELYDKLYDLKSSMTDEDWAKSGLAMSFLSVSAQLQEIQKITDQNKADAKAYLENKIIADQDTTGKDLYYNYQKATDDYNKALLIGNQEEIAKTETAWQRLSDQKDKYLSKHSDYTPLFNDIDESLNETAIRSRELYKQMTSEEGRTAIEATFGTVKENKKVGKDTQKELISAAKNYLKERKKIASGKDVGVTENIETLQRLETAAQKADIPIKSVVDMLNNTNSISGLKDMLANTAVTAEDVSNALMGANDEASRAIAELAQDFGLDLHSPREEIDAFTNYLAEMGHVVASTSSTSQDSLNTFFTDVSGKIDKLNTLTSVVQKGLSQTGLSFTKLTDEKGNPLQSEVSQIIDAYKNLEGYDLGSLFEETANGIQLNMDAYRALSQEEEAETKRQYMLERARLENDLAHAAPEDQKAIQQQIVELDMLSSAYDGATSALQKYLNQQNASDYGDTYAMLRDTTFKRGDELLNQHMIGTEEFRSIAQLFSNKSLATASVDDVVEAYKTGTQNIKKYFTEDAVDGVYQFALDIEGLGDKFGNVTRSINEQGEEVFDFSYTDEQVKNLADHLQVSVDVVESLFDQMRATGASIYRWRDGGFNTFDELNANINASRDSLKELAKESNDPNLVNLDIDANDLNTVDKLKEQISSMEDLKANLDVNSDAYKEAERYIDELKAKLKEYEQAAEDANKPLTVEDYSSANDMLDQMKQSFAEIAKYKNEDGTYKFNIEEGGSTTLTELANQIALLPPEIQEEMKFEATTDPDEILAQMQQKFNEQYVDVPVGADTAQAQQDVAQMTDTMAGADVPIDFYANTGQIQQQVDEVANSSGTVDIDAQVTGDKPLILQWIDGIKSTLVMEADASEIDAARQQAEQPLEVQVGANTSQAQSDINNLGTGENSPTITPQVDSSQAKSDLNNITNNGETTMMHVDADTSQAESKVDAVISKVTSPITAIVGMEVEASEVETARANAEKPIETPVTFKATNDMQQVANGAGAQGVTATRTENVVKNEQTNVTVNANTGQLSSAQGDIDRFKANDGASVNMSVSVSGVDSITQASNKVDDLAAKNGKKVNITIGGNTAAFNKTITNATTQLNTLNKKATNPTIKADNSKLISAADKAKSKLDSIKSKSITISAHSNGFSSIQSQLSRLKNKDIYITTHYKTVGKPSSGGGFQGTAHSQGTIMSGGKAYAGGVSGGNWGLPRAEKGALINELGSEVIVTPDGHWQILNDGDPTFTNLPKGTIIFNHKQSESLLKQGYINGSHGKIVGGAFARGTVDEDEDIDEEDLDELTGDAFALGTTGWNGQLSGEAHAGKGKWNASKAKRSSSSKSKSSGGHSSKSHKSKSKKGKKSKSSKSSSSSKAKDFLETLDAIEIQINRIDALFQQLDTNTGKTYRSFTSRTQNLNTEFSKLQAEIKRVDNTLKSTSSSTSYLRKAADAARTAGLKKGDEGYKAGSAGASGVGLSSAWTTKIRNSVDSGRYMTLNDVKDEGLWKKIQAYQTWYEKHVKLQQKKQDYINKLSQLTIQKLQLIQSQYNMSLETISNTLTRNQNLLDLQTSKARDQANSYFNGKYNAYNKQIKTLQAEARALTSALNQGVRNGTITRGSEEWTKWSNQIASINNDIIKAQKDIADTAVAQIQYVQDKWQTTLDMLETNMDTYEKWIDRFQYTQNIYPHQINATNRSDSTLKYYETEISLNKTRMADLQAQANAMASALSNAVKNNRIQKNSEEWKKWLTQIQQVKNEIIETQNAISRLAVDKLEHIQTRWETSIDHMSTILKRFEAFADLEETKGYDISEKYYQAQIIGNNKILNELTRKASNLQQSLNEAVIHGRILTYSEEWYKWAESIEDVKNEIVSTQEEIADLNNEIRQLAWDRFERIQDQISDVVDEMDFLNGLIYENDLFEENGMVTDKGRASGGLIAQQYDLLMKEAQNYRKEILAINEDIAKDPNNQKLIKQRNDWIKSQQSVIENARKQKEAMVDLAEKGIKKQIDYMSDLIDKYEEALDKQRDQEQYAKNIADKQKSISNLEKQLRSMGGDDSEEGRARRQRLQDQLKQAREDLQDTQEDKRLSDIKDMLGDMQDKYEDVLNDRLDNIDQLFSDAITVINQNGADIAATIRAVGASVGYNLTTNINKTYEGVANTDDNSSDTALVSGTVNGNFNNGSATTLKTAQQAEADAEHARQEADNTATKNIASVTTTTVKTTTTTTTTKKPTTTTKKKTTTAKKVVATTKKIATTTKKKTTTKKVVKNGDTYENGKHYYYKNGVRQAGFFKIGNYWYYHDPSTKVRKMGSYTAYGYSIDSSPKTGAVKNGFVRTPDGKVRYIKGGKQQTGWQSIGGKKYYFSVNKGRDGEMFKGMQKIGDKTYYFNSSGVLQTKDFSLNGLKYDVDSKDGHIRTAKNNKGKVVKKYAKGTKYVPKTDMYQVDEEGQEVFINSKGKIYTRLEKGAAVLPHKAALNLLDGMSNPVEFIKDHMDLRPNKSITNTTTSGDTYNNVTFNLPRVTNYSEFMREAQKDPNFTKYIQEISIGTLNGNNSLKGNSIRFR